MLSGELIRLMPGVPPPSSAKSFLLTFETLANISAVGAEGRTQPVEPLGLGLRRPGLELNILEVEE